jgi:hypothetical protein
MASAIAPPLEDMDKLQAWLTKNTPPETKTVLCA